MDLDTVRIAFLSYGNVVMPLSPSAVFKNAPGVWPIVSDGEMFITADNDGQLALPFQTADSARTVLADAPTIHDLRTQASKYPGN